MYTRTHAHRTTHPNTHPARPNNQSFGTSRIVETRPGTNQHVLSATERIHRALFSDYISQRSTPERPVR